VWVQVWGQARVGVWTMVRFRVRVRVRHGSH